MNVFQIPLPAVTDEGLAIDAELPGADLRPEGAAELPLGSVHLKGTLSNDGDEFIFNGHLETRYLGQCDRCLGPAETPLRTDVLWVFMQGASPQPSEEFEDEEEDATLDDGVIRAFFEDNVLDLRGAAWEEIVLSTPLKQLCSETCSGLCPICGTNWNESSCECQTAEDSETLENKGLKGLKDLYPDMNPDRLED